MSGIMAAIDDLRATLARLRAPGGCPWDREQTHQSLSVCLVDEVSELLDTIDRLDHNHMREELGDVLLQVLFHAQIAEEDGRFNFDDVAAEINEKLIRRHPHVFGTGVTVNDSAGVIVEWDKVKAAEKVAKGQKVTRFKEAHERLPALHFARDVRKVVAKQKLDDAAFVDNAEVAALAGGLDEAAAGRMLYTIAAACRIAGVDAEAALRRHCLAVVDTLDREAGQA